MSYEPGSIYRITMASHAAVDPWGYHYEIPCYEILESLEIQATDEYHEWEEPWSQQKEEALIYSTEDGRGFWGRPPTDFGGHTQWIEIDPEYETKGYWVAESALPVKVIWGGVPWFTERSLEQIRLANKRLAEKRADLERS